MNGNYVLTAIVGLAVIALIIYLVWRNKKDRVTIEKDITLSEMKPEDLTDDMIRDKADDARKS